MDSVLKDRVWMVRGLTKSERIVLLAILFYSDERSEFRMEAKRFSMIVGLCRAYTSRCLGELSDLGYIIKIPSAQPDDKNPLKHRRVMFYNYKITL